MDEISVLAVDVPRGLGRNWGWFLVLGIALAALGVLAIAYSSTATVASMYFFGGVLLAAAAVECINAIMVGKWSGFFLHLLGVLLFGVTGFLLLKYPSISAESLTVLMAAYFIVGGTFEVIAPLFVGLPDSGWHVLNGIVSILLGILVLAQWPVSGLWAIGMFVGIDLVFRGITWMIFAFGLRDFREDASRFRAELRHS
jgi:uncharacterized membrane protein HdeD (DUF308 family)